MPIFYNRVQRPVNPGDAESAKKWYPRVKSISLASEKEVAQLISDETTLNPKEAEMALAQLEKAVKILLLAGRNVRLGDWASFYVTVTSEGTEAEEECNATKIKKVVPHCHFTREFRNALQSASFLPGESMLKKTKKNSAPSGDGGGSGSGGSDDPDPGVTE